MKFQPNPECPVCRANGVSAYSTGTWPVWGVEYSLMTCKDCGSHWTDPMPDDSVLSKVYSECFNYQWYQDHYGAKLRDCRERIGEYRPFLGRRVLDFGGGVGYLSAALRKEGYESVTYDPFCRKDDVTVGLWDTVIALHVIEHANDPSRTLEEMKCLLANDGKLLLAVPNAAGKGYRERGMEWVWAQPPLIHTIHFTAAGLTALLEHHGFAVESVSFAERWDANLCTDLERVKFHSRLDQAWSRQPWHNYALYRKGCALISSLLRFRGLRKARQGYDSANADYSELQIVARLATA
jgi:2-polyprenyl-6-hydroxyphenyl methylase/3-demethylubiquinone-9 3-methyltransferase